MITLRFSSVAPGLFRRSTKTAHKRSWVPLVGTQQRVDLYFSVAGGAIEIIASARDRTLMALRGESLTVLWQRSPDPRLLLGHRSHRRDFSSLRGATQRARFEITPLSLGSNREP